MGREDWMGAEPNISALRSAWVLQGEFPQAATVLGWTFTSVIRVICLVALVTSLKSCLHSPLSSREAVDARGHRPQLGGCRGAGLPLPGVS